MPISGHARLPDGAGLGGSEGREVVIVSVADDDATAVPVVELFDVARIESDVTMVESGAEFWQGIDISDKGQLG